MAKASRFVTGAFGTGTTPFSLLASDRTDLPTAAIVVVSVAVTPGTPVNDLSLSFGVTDFTTTACVSVLSDHNLNPTGTARRHATGKILSMLDPNDPTNPLTTLRSATVAAVAGGIQLTPEQSGATYAVRAWLFFEDKWEVVNNVGDGIYSTDEIIAFTHTLGGPARLGIIASAGEFESETVHANFSFGVFRDAGAFDEVNPNTWLPSISQACVSFRYRDAITPSDNSGRAVTDRVSSLCNNSGGEFSGQEITDNAINQIQVTNRTGGATSVGLIGLISNVLASDTSIGFINAPTNAAVDWTLTGLTFEPDAMLLVTTMMDVVPYGTSAANAGAFGFFGVDSLSTEGGLAVADEHNVAASDTQSRADAGLVLTDHNGAVTFDLDTVVLTADGFLCDDLDITTADSTQRKFLSLIIGKAGQPPPPPQTITRVGEIDNLNVVYDNETLVKIVGTLMGSTGVVTMSDYEVAGAGSGTEVTQPQTSYSNDLIVITAMDKGALIPDQLWINVTPTAGVVASFPMTCRADPGAGNMALRGNPVQQTGTEGVSFSFATGDYIYAGYLAGTDVLTITATSLPTGLTVSVDGVITGTVATGAATSSPFGVNSKATDLAMNEVSDPFVWTITAPPVDPPDPPDPPPASPSAISVSIPQFRSVDAKTLADRYNQGQPETADYTFGNGREFFQ